MDEQQARFDLDLARLAVHRQLDLVPGHHRPPARAAARSIARAMRTRAISRLYSTLPRRSAAGSAAAAACRATAATVAASGLRPASVRAASTQWTGVGPTLVSARPALATVPSAASASCAAAAA